MACIKEYDCGTRFCTPELSCFIEEKSPLKIGDTIKDCDGTIGKVIEIKDAGSWVRYRCRPHACLADLICRPEKAMHVRRFWNMRRNLIKT